MKDNTSLDLEFSVGGYSEVVNAIRRTEPDIRREMDKTIRGALNLVKAKTKGNYPKGDWGVQINKRSLFGSIYARGGDRWEKQALDDLTPGIRASVLEFIGSAYSGDRPQVLGLIASMERRYGKPGRFLWAAWDEAGPAALETIRAGVQRAEKRLQASLDAAGEVY